MTGRFVLAFDVGTSGVKAVLADLRGRVVASRYHPYGLRALDGGRVEQDVGEIYGGLGAACRSLLDWRGVNPKHVEAVSVTAQMFNVVPVGAAGEPLAPMLSWLDTRATPQAAALAAAMDPDEQFRRLGATITAKDILPKILWLKERQPEVYARTSKLLDCKEVVVALLTGELVTDHAGASAYRLADLDAGGWDADACQAVGVSPALLPEVAAATDLAGGVTDAAAAETGLQRGTPVVVGAGDVPASQVGAGATEHGDAHVSLGTAVYFGITLDRPATDPGRQLAAQLGGGLEAGLPLLAAVTRILDGAADPVALLVEAVLPAGDAVSRQPEAARRRAGPGGGRPGAGSPAAETRSGR
jgi:sugar (pentulose or hexulose) kinase